KRCENQSPSWIYPLFLHPLDKSAITLTSHRWLLSSSAKLTVRLAEILIGNQWFIFAMFY
ncbi:MAG: hypothetical protein V7K14_19445, partial [Nostoc sp.]|uniref:hypothetical protein n=1 Tax=Nostoc sp. TaxID=1180 RepID=UPI002FF7F02A